MDHFNTTMMVKWIHLVVLLLQVYEGTATCMMRRMPAICMDNNYLSMIFGQLYLQNYNNIFMLSIDHHGNSSV
jgi:hypothetical protein